MVGPSRMPPAEASRGADEPDRGAYAQPTPRLLYVHDDLSDEVAERLGPASPAAALTRSLFALLKRDPRGSWSSRWPSRSSVSSPWVGMPHSILPSASAEPASAWPGAPREDRLVPARPPPRLTREEDGRGNYNLVSTVPATLAAQLAGGLKGFPASASLAVVDDTVFSGLTLRSVLETCRPVVLPRTHGFLPSRRLGFDRCRREALPGHRRRGRGGTHAGGRDFINASGLVLRVGIRRRARPPLAFFERPQWIRAWFPGRDREVIAACRRLNALLDSGG